MATGRIDVHHHVIPPFFRDAINNTPGGDPSGWHVPEWTVESDTAFNDKFGIATTILSLTAPGAGIVEDPDESAQLARKANEFCAKIRDEQPKRYGFFATLPDLLNKDKVLEELAYAFDTLKADGVILLTRYGKDNHYLGHPDFEDIWSELNRREAVVFIHPTHPVDIHQVSNLPQPIIQYTFETTLTAVDLLVNKTVRKNPKVKMILSHAGGTLPYILNRPASMITNTAKELDAFLEDASNFYYDTALSGSQVPLQVLESFAKPGHVLYGSDTPYASEKMIEFHTSRQDEHQFNDTGMAAKINRTNALELFPRLKKA